MYCVFFHCHLLRDLPDSSVKNHAGMRHCLPLLEQEERSIRFGKKFVDWWSAFCLRPVIRSAEGVSNRLARERGKGQTSQIWRRRHEACKEIKAQEESSSAHGHWQEQREERWGHLPPDGHMLISKSISEGVDMLLWRTDTWDRLCSLPLDPKIKNMPLTFLSNWLLLQTRGASREDLRFWDVDVLCLFHQPTLSYINTRVVLIGKSGVGTTGLLNALPDRPFQVDTGDESGLLILFFQPQASQQTHGRFENHVREPLLTRTVAGSVQRFRVLHCPNCRIEIPRTSIQLRRQRQPGLPWLTCSICYTRTVLIDDAVDLHALPSEKTLAVETVTEYQSHLEIAHATRREDPQRSRRYDDLWLCSSPADKAEVKHLSHSLLKHSHVLCWGDTWNVRPGKSWREVVCRQILNGSIEAAILCMGTEKHLPWDDAETYQLLQPFVSLQHMIVPMLLRDADEAQVPRLPVSVNGHWPVMRSEPDHLHCLIAPGCSVNIHRFFVHMHMQKRMATFH